MDMKGLMLIADDGGAMAIDIITHRDALRHTARRVVVAVSLTVVLTWSLTLMQFGTDPDATVRAGFVTKSIIMIGIIVAALLTAGLSYRSALVMRELARARAELLRISCTDQLTGLLNRRGFDEAAVSALTKAHEANLPTTVLMCDIDRFKAINDQFGHEFGDKVIIGIAEVLRAFAGRSQMLVARHGGEEFAALMTGVSRERAAHYAEELRQACAAKEILSEEMSACVTISIGLAVCRAETDLSKVMRMADQALYAAKHRGRNRVERADFLTGSIAA
jgi:diguanylate cyclase (GGDEF)-like protein